MLCSPLGKTCHEADSGMLVVSHKQAVGVDDDAESWCLFVVDMQRLVQVQPCRGVVRHFIELAHVKICNISYIRDKRVCAAGKVEIGFV